MKRFSFIAGNKADPTSGMQIEVRRDQVPANMKVGLWLDDDGKAFPKLAPQNAPSKERILAGKCGEFVLLDRTRIRAKLCGFDGVLTLEPGTRFDAGAGGGSIAAEVTGGRVTVREGRRFAELDRPIANIALDRQPNEIQVLTLEAEKPAGARPGERFRVDVVQKRLDGVIVGGVTAVFVFD